MNCSGSIGQVYKIKSKYDDRYFAMKVPTSKCQFKSIPTRLYTQVLYNAPMIKDYVRYYFPVETGDFIKRLYNSN